MIHFSSQNLIFIEVPKTATSSIVSQCLAQKPSLERNKVFLNSLPPLITHTHISADFVNKSLLRHGISNVFFFAFFRNPVDVIRSKYYFYKSGRARSRVNLRFYKLPIKLLLNVLLANLFPLPLWALFVPYTSSSQYIVDSNGKIIVDILCDYSRISEYTYDILVSQFNVFDSFVLPQVNVSRNSHIKPSQFESSILKRIVTLRLRDDMKIWSQLVESGGILVSSRYKYKG